MADIITRRTTTARRAGRLRLLTLLVVLVLTGPHNALAECAWVLWSSYSEHDPSASVLAPRVYRREHRLLSAHETRARCTQAGEKYMETVKHPASLKVLGLEDSGAASVDRVLAYPRGRRDRLVELNWECWPDTVDPRGPKGTK